ncbi:glycoside hydrolase superfamily [Aspergillus crustosus]
MFQAFEWHVPDDKAHWRRLQRALSSFKAMGIDNIWIPPGCKAANPSENGYDIYDLHDLGDFAFGAQELGTGVIWDAVLNHKAGADSLEQLLAVKVDPKDRNQEISPATDIAGWVGFGFPGRGNHYSALRYNKRHFAGVDWDENLKENAIFKISGPNKGWAADVSNENGNYDYLMFANLDYSNPEVREDVLHWGSWIATQLPLAGMRLDAVKHFSASFQNAFIENLRTQLGEDFFFVGEYWKAELDVLVEYLERMEYRLSLFDVPLLDRFSKMSRTEGADMRQIFEDTLVQWSPENAVTFVANHDTQSGQSLEAPVMSFFKPLAYALILLRDKGQPCVFYGDLYGIFGDNKTPQRLNMSLYANGEQRDYFDRENCIGFVRYGNLRHPFGLACIMSNAGSTRKRMYIGQTHSGEQWTDILGNRTETVTIDKKGYGVFPVAAYSVSVWVDPLAENRDTLHQVL